MSSRSSQEGARIQEPGGPHGQTVLYLQFERFHPVGLEVGCIRKIGSPKRICFRERTTEYTENPPGSWLLLRMRELIPTDPTVLWAHPAHLILLPGDFLQVSLNIREGSGVESVSNKLTSYREKNAALEMPESTVDFPAIFRLNRTAIASICSPLPGGRRRAN
jgi:hypothetical protein